MIHMSEQEQEYVAKLLKRRHDELLHELHHAVTREYKDGLRQEIDVTEKLLHKIQPVTVSA
ncbi:MAG: hypothetical protein HC897_10140 [Thermoanaerobaculia bacterium]|nr:hypothetical protein [Thermoanaerobaculia bacterium]